jgi:tripartite-type tricarboxylate transporter receptor subunit TctC
LSAASIFQNVFRIHPLTELIGGQVHFMFDNMPSSIAYIKDGKLRPLAVTTGTRSEGLPQVPTVAEFVPGFEAMAVGGVGVPRNTPIEIIDKLNRDINAGLADPKIKALLADMAVSTLVGSPSNYGQLLSAETEKWAKVIKFANIKLG